MKRELWVMDGLSANLQMTMDNESSLLPKTQSSACENMATSELKLSDSKKKLRIFMHANLKSSDLLLRNLCFEQLNNDTM